MPIYRKRPVEIEAHELKISTCLDLARWCCGRVVKDGRRYAGVLIPTLEGTTVASMGDYIIRGVAGEFYACKPDIFAATYEKI